MIQPHPVIQKKEGFNGQKTIVVPTNILQKSCLQHPVLAGIHLTDIGFYPKAKFHYRERSKGIDQYILLYCVGGKGEVNIEEQNYLISTGNFLVIPAEKAHTYCADEFQPWSIYWVHFKGNQVAALVALLLKRQKSLQGSVQYDESRIKLFDDIYLNLERGYSVDNLCYASMTFWHFLSSFIFEEKLNYALKKNVLNPVEMAIDYMQKNLHTTLTLEGISNAVNLSASHFSAIFKEQTGLAPIKYFNQLKVQKACQYIQLTTLRIKEISAALGIDDPYYFSRMFSKIMGISPQDYKYRREIKKDSIV